jgi:epoxyqueuosine reductase
VSLTSAQIQQLAHACGFEIAGVTAALPHPDFTRFEAWQQSGKAADLTYLTDHRSALRANPQALLPNAQSIICLGKRYHTDRPLSTEAISSRQGWISRYAWGLDYHDVLRPPLESLTRRLGELNGAPFDSKICIDTAPLLERSYARAAGLGWIGKNTCLINQQHGSWFFLAELLVSIPITPDVPAPDRCGTCTRCIQACPTGAIVPNADSRFDIDSRLCLSYLTIEKRGPIPDSLAALHGHHIFGCDICQDVCPWNQRARSDVTDDASFAARIFAPDLAELSALHEDDFRRLFRRTPIWRTKYEGFLRNVAIAMGNSGAEAMREPLTRLTRHSNNTVSQTAVAALARLTSLLKSWA